MDASLGGDPRGAEGGAGESGAGQGAGEEGERVPKVTAVCTGASDALAGHLPGERAEGAGRFRLCWSQVALGDTGLPPRQHLGSGSGESQGVWEAPGADRKSAVGEERPGPREEGLTLGHFSVKKNKLQLPRQFDWSQRSDLAWPLSPHVWGGRG